MTLIDKLRKLEYPGRLIVIGLLPNSRCFLIYLITGRSSASQARKLVLFDHKVLVQPSDEAIIRKGNPDLLIYSAIMITNSGAVISNGKQSESIQKYLLPGRNPASILQQGLEGWDYEPDSPIYTPRISGCVVEGKIALSVVRRGPGGLSLKNYFELPSVEGTGYLVSTYLGPNRDPLPCFEGEPVEVKLDDIDPQTAAENIYKSLTPARPEADFRVATACVIFDSDSPSEAKFAIINRQESN